MKPNYPILGVDLGFVQTKAVGKEWSTKFGSLVKPRSDVAITGIDDSEGFLVSYMGHTYNVGAKGSYDFNANRLTRETDVAKLLAVFGQFQRLPVQEIQTVVTGLPVYEFNSYRETMKQKLKQQFHYAFQGKERWTIVKDVQVIPQSAGAYYDFILDDNGEPKTDGLPKELASEDVLVLDIGGRTTDGCIMEASKYSQDSFTIFQGVWKTHNELRRLIMKEYRYNMKPAEVDSVMRSGTLKLGRDEVGVGTFIQKAIANVYPELRDELTLHVDDFRRYSAVLLTGGGAHVFSAYIEEDVTCPVYITDGAEYANASGYRKYGKLVTANQKD